MSMTKEITIVTKLEASAKFDARQVTTVHNVPANWRELCELVDNEMTQTEAYNLIMGSGWMVSLRNNHIKPMLKLQDDDYLTESQIEDSADVDYVPRLTGNVAKTEVEKFEKNHGDASAADLQAIIDHATAQIAAIEEPEN